MRFLAASLVTVFVLAACSSNVPEDDRIDASPVRDTGTRDTGTVIDSGVEPTDTGTPDAGNPDVFSPPQCDDPNDLGGETDSIMLPGITDKDANPLHKTTGVAAGVGDVDSFTFFGTDAAGSVVDLRASININNVEFCAFVKCANGVTKRGTCSQGAPAVNTAGNSGCCGTRSVAFDWNCGGVFTGENANVWFRVKPTAPVCSPYTIEYTL
jgi:hypothetical protein